MPRLPCRSEVQLQDLADAEAEQSRPLRRTEGSLCGGRVKHLRLRQRVVAAFPADHTFARRANVAIPVGPLAPGHRHDEAILDPSDDNRCAKGFARAAAAMLENSIQRK